MNTTAHDRRRRPPQTASSWSSLRRLRVADDAQRGAKAALGPPEQQQEQVNDAGRRRARRRRPERRPTSASGRHEHGTRGSGCCPSPGVGAPCERIEAGVVNTACQSTLGGDPEPAHEEREHERLEHVAGRAACASNACARASRTGDRMVAKKRGERRGGRAPPTESAEVRAPVAGSAGSAAPRTAAWRKARRDGCESDGRSSMSTSRGLGGTPYLRRARGAPQARAQRAFSARPARRRRAASTSVRRSVISSIA